MLYYYFLIYLRWYNNRSEEVTMDKWIAWAVSLDADADEDAARAHFSEVCGYSEEEGGDTPVKGMDLALFACALIRVGNAYYIQNMGNPMDSDIPTQLQKFWEDKVVNFIAMKL